jgi:hypothetical protein
LGTLIKLFKALQVIFILSQSLEEGIFSLTAYLLEGIFRLFPTRCRLNKNSDPSFSEGDAGIYWVEDFTGALGEWGFINQREV